MRNLDRHFKCPKSLKTMFALTPMNPGEKRKMMDAHNHFIHQEYAVEPRGERSIPAANTEKRPQRKKAA